MKTKHFYLLLICALSANLFAQVNTKPAYMLELENDIKKMSVLQDGKYLFLTSDEYAWLVQPDSGKKLWSVKVKGYDENAVHTLLFDSLYLVSGNNDSLFCYSIFSKSLLWKTKFKDIDQDDFVELKTLDTLLLIRYDKFQVGVSLLSGKELWRAQIKYYDKVKEFGAANNILLEKHKKLLAFGNDDDIMLYDALSGKQLLQTKKTEINFDFVKQKRAWNYITDDQKFACILLDGGILVLDLDSAKQILKIEKVKYDEEYNAIIPTSLGCVVAGSKKITSINFSAGTFVQAEVDIDELRNYAEAKTESAIILIVSAENKLFGIDITNSKLLWQTKKEQKQYTGFLHTVVLQDTNSIVCHYVNPDNDVLFSLLKIDALTGEIKFKKDIALTNESLPKRALPLSPIEKIQSQTKIPFSYDNLGFDFSFSLNADTAEYLIVTKTEMREPKLKKRSGEGFVRVNARTGEEIAANYIKIAEDLGFKGGLANLAKPLTNGSTIFVAGDEKLVAFNKLDANVQWMLGSKQLNGGNVFDMVYLDGFLYVKTGGVKYKFVPNEKSKSKREKKILDQKLDWEDDNIAILAVDPADGKVMWRKELKSDPALFAHQFSLANYLNADSTLLFLSDEKFVYALRMEPTSAGNFAWKFEPDDSGAGTIKIDDMYRKAKLWKESISASTLVTDYYTDSPLELEINDVLSQKIATTMSRPLHITYSKQDSIILSIGDDGILASSAVNGKRKWKHEWSYSGDEVITTPIVMQNHIFYFVNGKATLIDKNNGKIVWQVKTSGEDPLFVLPSHTAIVRISGDEIYGYKIPSIIKN